jgi:hypothetical protein
MYLIILALLSQRSDECNVVRRLSAEKQRTNQKSLIALHSVNAFQSLLSWSFVFIAQLLNLLELTVVNQSGRVSVDSEARLKTSSSHRGGFSCNSYLALN